MVRFILITAGIFHSKSKGVQTMATKKVKSPNEQLWAKEIRRLRQFIRRAEKRGFSYADSIIPEKPAKVTKKSIQHLQSLTPDKLYGRATYIDPQTGVTLTGKQGRALERSRASTKAARTVAIRQGKSVSVAPVLPTMFTESERAWKKEATRVNALIRRLESRGYIFPVNLVSEKPYNVKREDIEYLKGITSKTIYHYGEYRDPQTGQIVTGVEGRRLERSRAGKKGYQTRIRNEQERELKKQEEERKKREEQESKKKPKNSKKPAVEPPEEPNLPSATYEIIENVREEIRKWAPSPHWTEFFSETKARDKNILENMFEGAIRQEGEEVIAARLEAHATEVIALVQDILYGSGGKDGNRIQNDFARFSQILLGRSLTVYESIELAEAQEYLEDNEEVE